LLRLTSMQNDAEVSQIKRGVGLIGSTEPRIHTPLLKGRSKAQEVSDLADKIGLPLIPWQRWVLDDLLSVDDNNLAQEDSFSIGCTSEWQDTPSTYAYPKPSIPLGL